LIAVDTNLLIYAHREDSPWHEVAFSIVKELAESPAAWAIPWPCIDEFFSIVTHPRIYRPPRVHDARVAALCIEHGVRELWTADRDFSRFASIRVRNPLVE